MTPGFAEAIRKNQSAFGLSLPAEKIAALSEYFQLVLKNNPILHLVAPCTVEEFVVRHILESLALLKYLPEGARFADVGSGAGLPSIPCLLVREDLSGVLIESKEKKAVFLNESISSLGLSDRTTVANKQFQEVTVKTFSFVTCRALDRFTERLSRLLKWSEQRPLLLFGGPSLGEALDLCHRDFDKVLLPLSNQRFLYLVDRSRT